MSSRSATVLVIFIVACIAFCLASVFGAMTGPISILPNENDTGSVLDNLSAITDSDDNVQTYGYDDSSNSNDYSSSSSQSSEPQVETTSDDSQSSSSSSSSTHSETHVETTEDTSISSDPGKTNDNVKTTEG
jgi:hypothetical protein